MLVATKPNIDAATVTARVISRLLRSAGLKMADTSDRHRWTEGFHVHRLGVSRTVVVGYHTDNHFHFQDSVRAAQAAVAREACDKARALLLERGYEFDPTYPDLLYINCERAE